MVFHVAFVQPERKLIDVAGQMLGAGVVIDADQPALENGKNALNAVRGNVIADVLACAVVDCVVPVKQATDIAIDRSLIGVQRRADFDVLNNYVRYGSASVALMTLARVRPPRSRNPRTAVLPTAPRPAFSFFCSCLLPSIPPT